MDMKTSPQDWRSLEQKFKRENARAYRFAAQDPSSLKIFWLNKRWLNQGIRQKIENYVEDHKAVLERLAKDNVNLHIVIEALVYLPWSPTKGGADFIMESLSSPKWQKLPRALRKTATQIRECFVPVQDILQGGNQRNSKGKWVSELVNPPEFEEAAAKLERLANDVDVRLRSPEARREILRSYGLPYGRRRFKIREDTALLKLRTLFERAGVKGLYARLAETVRGAFSSDPDEQSIPRRIEGLINRDRHRYKSAIDDWQIRFIEEGVIKPPKKMM